MRTARSHIASLALGLAVGACGASGANTYPEAPKTEPAHVGNAEAPQAPQASRGSPEPEPTPSSQWHCHKTPVPDYLDCYPSREKCDEGRGHGKSVLLNQGATDEKAETVLGPCESRQPWCFDDPEGNLVCAGEEQKCEEIREVTEGRERCAERR